MTLTVFIYDKIILTEAELTSTFTFLIESSCRREEYPVNILLVHQCVQIEVAQRTHTTHNLLGDGTAIDNSQDANLYLNLPQEGWAFMGWADEDGNIVATDNPFTYTGRANAHFVAVMKEYRDCPDYNDPDYTNPSAPGVNPNTPELREVIVSNIKVAVENDQIVVENTGDYTVTLYDVAGRALESRISPDQKIYFSVPLSGSYLVRVGNLMTQRVVVVR